MLLAALMLGGKPGAERADAAGADHRDAEIGPCHSTSPKLPSRDQAACAPLPACEELRRAVWLQSNFLTSSFRSDQMRE